MTDDRQAQLRQTQIKRLRHAIALARGQDDDDAAGHERDTLAAMEEELQLLENWKPEPPPPPELMTEVRMRSYIQRAIYEDKLQGAEAELHQEMGLDRVQLPPDLAGATIIPVWALADRTREVRERAAVAVTTGDYATNIRNYLGQVFAGTDADFLGARIEVVPGGQARYPVISGIGAPEPKAKGAAGTERDGTVTVNKLSAKRLTSFLTLNEVDDEIDWSQLETAMTNQQRQSLMHALGNSIINGTGTDPQPQGILAGVASIADETTTTTFAQMKEKLVAGVDGELASSEAGIRLLLGAETYRTARGLYRTNSSERDAIDMLRGLGASVQVSPHIPDASSNRQYGIRVTDGPAIAIPIWSYYTLVRDPYTKAENNQVRLIAHLFHNVKVLRQDGVVGLSFKLS